MSNVARHPDSVPRGTKSLRADLTEGEMASAPFLDSVDLLLVDDLADDEDDAFAAALTE